MVTSTGAKGLRVYRSRFDDRIKHEGKPEAFQKSRLLDQAYIDNDHGFLTHTPTVQRVSQLLLLSLCAIDNRFTFITRDVSQAYVQLETMTRHKFYVRAPNVLNLPSDTLLRVERPLYAIPEAGLHW